MTESNMPVEAPTREDGVGGSSALVTETDKEKYEASLLSHAESARRFYANIRGTYADFARTVQSVIEIGLAGRSVNVHSVTSRAKELESFEAKSARPGKTPGLPKYPNPLFDITDLAGVRVITYFMTAIPEVASFVDEQFEICEKTDKNDEDPTRVGYQSLHLLVRLKENRTNLPEHSRFTGLTCEIQIRTILQHTWAEIEHDINYKAVGAVPDAIRRRFSALAGLVEIADREFEAIRAADEIERATARERVSQGDLTSVEITGDSLKTYLDTRFGPDARMASYSYDAVASLLVHAGFQSLGEVEECVSDYNDDAISRALYGSRQGQLTRFEDVLLAAMGKYWIDAHPWSSTTDWFAESTRERLERLAEAEIDLGEFRPSGSPSEAQVRDVIN